MEEWHLTGLIIRGFWFESRSRNQIKCLRSNHVGSFFVIITYMFNKSKAKIWDAIIIGGGPAGLSLGSELSDKHRVLVIDKGIIGNTTKTWTVDKALAKKQGLEDFVTSSFSKCTFKVSPNEKVKIHLDLVSLDERNLLDYWKKVLRKNKAKLL